MEVWAVPYSVQGLSYIVCSGVTLAVLGTKPAFLASFMQEQMAYTDA